MKHSLIILLSLFVLSSCNYDDDPIGHWHIQTPDHSFNSYFTIDFEEDSLILGGKYSINPYVGKYVIDEDSIYIGGECGYGYFKYKVRNDKIYLDEYLVDRELEGFRCDSNCCNIKDDFLNRSDLKVKIDLHEIIKKRKEFNPINLEDEYFINLQIGSPLEMYDTLGYGDYELQLNDKFAPVNMIPFFVQEKLLGYKKENIHFRIFTEKSTPISRLKEIVDELKKEEIKNNIWLVCASRDENDLFEYIYIDSLDLNREGELQDFLY